MNQKGKNKLPLITTILIVINAAVFLITDLVFFREQNKIIYYMALNTGLVLNKGEFWRLFTCMFYHFDIEHVMFNMLMLYFVGVIIEPFLGRIRFLILYFVSGLLADAASIIYNSLIAGEGAKNVFEAGASGAIYGLFGAFAVILAFQRDERLQEERRRLPLMLFFLLFGNIFNKSVGHAAHFGGFFAGALLGACYCICLRRRRDGKTKG